MVMTNGKIISELKELEKFRKNVGTDLTLWRLIDLLILYFETKEEGK